MSATPAVAFEATALIAKMASAQIFVLESKANKNGQGLTIVNPKQSHIWHRAKWITNKVVKIWVA